MRIEDMVPDRVGRWLDRGWFAVEPLARSIRERVTHWWTALGRRTAPLSGEVRAVGREVWDTAMGKVPEDEIIDDPVGKMEALFAVYAPRSVDVGPLASEPVATGPVPTGEVEDGDTATAPPDGSWALSRH